MKISKRLNQKLSIIMVLLFSFFSFQAIAAKKAKNVIYFIGDGMGPTQITGARLYNGGSSSSLHMEKMKNTGFSRTFSSDQYVTDSAAAGTALASGVKTYNGSIGLSDPKVDPTKKSRKLQTLVDLAKKMGKSVGVITTTNITHATPASFYAHEASRKSQNSIALQLLNSQVDLALGGGRKNFLGPKRLDHEDGKPTVRVDGKDLFNLAAKKGWDIAISLRALNKFGTSHSKKILGLFEYDHMKFELDRKKDVLKEPSLSEMTNFAIKYLSRNPKGYFLIVEAGRIDHASHYNFAKRTFLEVIQLDKAVRIALKENTKDTLVVVTADHETGGLSVNGYGPRGFARGDQMLRNLDVKPGIELHNHSIISWGSGPGYKSNYKTDDKNPDTQQKATYHMDSAAHTAVDVPILANGPESWRFRGYMNNNLIAQKIAACMGTRFTSKVNLQNNKAFK